MISGKILRDAIISGANNINNQRSRVDELNVFPVPDGDTGTNMGMTVGASVAELNALDDNCTVGEAAKTAASAMLRGARGNSGVITSLLFRGFSKALEGKKEADTADIIAALKKAWRVPSKAVMQATEGTILTVARVASEEAAACGAQEIPALWDVVMTAGQKALEDTPNLLPVLKKAGVVDAGGQGIMIIFEGMGKVFHGEPMVAGGEGAPQQGKALHRERRQGRVHRRPDEGGGHQERLLHPVPHQQVRGRKRRKDACLCRIQRRQRGLHRG